MGKKHKYKQHYIPQCYLKQFATNDEKVFVYQKNGILCKKRYHPAEICYKKLLYEIDIKNPDNKIENYFSNIESLYSNFAQEILSLKNIESFKLDNEGKIKILLFILRIYFGNIKRKEENILPYEDHDNEFLIKIICAFDIRFIEQFILRKDFIFLLPQDNKFFITSDNPVIGRSNSSNGLLPGTNILSDMNFDIALSPYLHLRIVDKGYVPNFIEGIPGCDTKETNITGIYNKEMFKQCNTFIYTDLPININEYF